MLTRCFTFALCLGAMALWGMQLSWPRVFAGRNDFMQLYTGGVLAGTPDLYSSSANRTVNEHLGYFMPAVQYVRLPYYAALLKPLAKLPYRTAYFLFQALCFGALGAFLFFGWRRYPSLPWFALISVPLLTAFANGQDVVLVLALSAAALYLEDSGRPWLAGFCLALCTIKFHLFVFAPIPLLMHRRWRFAISAAIGVAVEMVVSFAVAGWRWPLQYANFLRNPDLHPDPYVRPNLSGLAENWVPLEIVLTLAVGALTVYACRRAKSFPAAFALAVVAGVLVAQHSYIQDCSLFLLVPLFVKTESAWVGQLSVILLTPFPYFLLMAEGVFGLITPALLLLWLVALAADACGWIPARKKALPQQNWAVHSGRA